MQFGVLTASLLVLASTHAAAGPAPAGRPTAASGQATCSAGQLAVGGLGSSVAAGTVILTVRVTDVSVDECMLGGYPAVTFIGSHGAVLHVSAAHAGPGAAFARPRPIVLSPSSKATAAFVITSTDDMAPQQHCAAVRAVRARLPADWNYAASGGGAACPTSTALVVTLPGGGQLVAHGKFQLCLDGGVGAFTPAG